MSTAPVLVPLSRQVLVDSVYDALKELVMDQRVEPGGRLSIEALARDLDVSPTPVREALARLEAEQLVTKEPMRGYRAAPLLDEQSFDDLYELRLLLEPRAARRAAERRTTDDLRALERALARMRGQRGVTTAPRRYATYRTFAANDAAFHDAVAAASGNDPLRQTLERVRPHLQLYRLAFHAGIGFETVAEHERIVAAVRHGDGDAAERAMTRHVQRSYERLRPALAGDST